MDIIIKNQMEEIVFRFLDKNLENLNSCTCDRCKRDIAALALNKLPPKYVVTEIGDVYARISEMEQQFEADFLTEIMSAITLVREKPRHDI